MKQGTEAPSILRGLEVVAFVNPLAGAGRAGGRVAQVKKLFQVSGVHAEFVVTKSAAELKSCAEDAIARGSKALFAMGGDGTFQTLANAAFGSNVLLGIIPLGGGNDFAAALGLPGDPLEAVKVILRGQPRLVDLVRVRTAEGQTYLYAGGGGIGLDAEAARHASGALRWLPGRLRYIGSALRALVGFVPIEVRVEFIEPVLPPLEAKVLLAAALNSPTYGGGLRLAPEATLGDGFLHIVLVKEIGTLGILRLLPRLISSGELRTDQVQRRRARKIRLTTTKPCAFHGDGEILGSTPVEIELASRAVQVLAPALS